MAQKDQGRPCVLVTGKEQGYDLHPLLGIGRGGKDEKHQNQAPASPPLGGCHMGQKLKRKSLKIQQLHTSCWCQVVILTFLCQKWTSRYCMLAWLKQ